MRASLGSDDTGEDYQLGRCLSTHREQATADSTMRRDIRFFHRIADLCLRRLFPQHVCLAFRIRSNKGRFGVPYSVVNR